MAVFISLYQPKRQIGLSSRDPALAEREWQEIKATLPAIVRVQVSADLTSLLRRSRQLAERWLLAQVVRTGAPAPWREVIHPDRIHGPRSSSPPMDSR